MNNIIEEMFIKKIKLDESEKESLAKALKLKKDSSIEDILNYLKDNLSEKEILELFFKKLSLEEKSLDYFLSSDNKKYSLGILEKTCKELQELLYKYYHHLPLTAKEIYLLSKHKSYIKNTSDSYFLTNLAHQIECIKNSGKTKDYKAKIDKKEFIEECLYQSNAFEKALKDNLDIAPEELYKFGNSNSSVYERLLEATYKKSNSVEEVMRKQNSIFEAVMNSTYPNQAKPQVLNKDIPNSAANKINFANDSAFLRKPNDFLFEPSFYESINSDFKKNQMLASISDPFLMSYFQGNTMYDACSNYGARYYRFFPFESFETGFGMDTIANRVHKAFNEGRLASLEFSQIISHDKAELELNAIDLFLNSFNQEASNAKKCYLLDMFISIDDKNKLFDHTLLNKAAKNADSYSILKTSVNIVNKINTQKDNTLLLAVIKSTTNNIDNKWYDYLLHPIKSFKIINLKKEINQVIEKTQDKEKINSLMSSVPKLIRQGKEEIDNLSSNHGGGIKVQINKSETEISSMRVEKTKVAEKNKDLSREANLRK